MGTAGILGFVDGLCVSVGGGVGGGCGCVDEGLGGGGRGCESDSRAGESSGGEARVACILRPAELGGVLYAGLGDPFDAE